MCILILTWIKSSSNFGILFKLKKLPIAQNSSNLVTLISIQMIDSSSGRKIFNAEIPKSRPKSSSNFFNSFSSNAKKLYSFRQMQKNKFFSSSANKLKVFSSNANFFILFVKCKQIKSLFVKCKKLNSFRQMQTN
jgi:hypothetical protein